MREVILRSYTHDRDYTGLRSLLEEAGLFDSDYEASDRVEAAVRRHPAMITVAVKGAVVVGGVYFQDGIIPSVNRLAVRREEQRQGIGSALLEAAEARARKLGHKYLELFVSPGNITARRFYENRGYAVGQAYTNMYRQLMPIARR